MIRTFQDLEVYKRSKKLFAQLTELVQDFPPEGKYLRSQLLRAANSIHANIAEGYGRSEKEFKQYLTRALASSNEVLSHIEDAQISGYLSKHDEEVLRKEYTVVGKQLYTLREKWHAN